MGWGLDYPDAENTLAVFYGPNKSPGANHSNFDHPEFNKLYDEAAGMAPGPQRVALLQRMNQIVAEEAATISGYSRTRVFLWHNNAIIWPQRDIIGNIFKYIDYKE
jgi:ABC-type oligopeptide transport system substrate-binding subunit